MPPGPNRNREPPFYMENQQKSVLKPLPISNNELPPGVHFRNGSDPEVLSFRWGQAIIFLSAPYTLTKMNDCSHDLCLSFFHKPYPASFFPTSHNHPQIEYFQSIERCIYKSWRIEAANFVRYEVVNDETYTCINLFYE